MEDMSLSNNNRSPQQAKEAAIPVGVEQLQDSIPQKEALRLNDVSGGIDEYVVIRKKDAILENFVPLKEFMDRNSPHPANGIENPDALMFPPTIPVPTPHDAQQAVAEARAQEFSSAEFEDLLPNKPGSNPGRGTGQYTMENRKNKLLRIRDVNALDLFQKGDVMELLFQKDEWYVARHLFKETEHVFPAVQCDILANVNDEDIEEHSVEKKEEFATNAHTPWMYRKKIESAKKAYARLTDNTDLLHALSLSSSSIGAYNFAYSAPADWHYNAVQKLYSTTSGYPEGPHHPSNTTGTSSAATSGAHGNTGEALQQHQSMYGSSGTTQSADVAQPQQVFPNTMSSTLSASHGGDCFSTGTAADPFNRQSSLNEFLRQQRTSQNVIVGMNQEMFNFYQDPNYGYGPAEVEVAPQEISANQAAHRTQQHPQQQPQQYAQRHNIPSGPQAASASNPARMQSTVSNVSNKAQNLDEVAINSPHPRGGYQDMGQQRAYRRKSPPRRLQNNDAWEMNGNVGKLSTSMGSVSGTNWEAEMTRFRSDYMSNKQTNEWAVPNAPHAVDRGTKFLCTFMVSIRDDPLFCVARRIIGPYGKHMKNISQMISGAKVRLRGRGSGFKERDTGMESPEELQINVSVSTKEGYQLCKHLLATLLKKIYDEYHRVSGHSVSLRLLEHPRNSSLNDIEVENFKKNPLFLFDNAYEFSSLQDIAKEGTYITLSSGGYNGSYTGSGSRHQRFDPLSNSRRQVQ